MNTQPGDPGKLEEAARIVTLPIRWEADASSPATVYANQLLISHAGPQFYLFFGELVPPAIPSADADKVPLPDHLSIKVVARIAVTPEAMVAFADAIKANVEHFKSSQGKAQ